MARYGAGMKTGQTLECLPRARRMLKGAIEGAAINGLAEAEVAEAETGAGAARTMRGRLRRFGNLIAVLVGAIDAVVVVEPVELRAAVAAGEGIPEAAGGAVAVA